MPKSSIESRMPIPASSSRIALVRTGSVSTASSVISSDRRAASSSHASSSPLTCAGNSTSSRLRAETLTAMDSARPSRSHARHWLSASPMT